MPKKPKLVDPRDTSGLDVRHLLKPDHKAYLDLLGPKFAVFAGASMKKDDDDDEGDDDDDDDDDDDHLELDPDDKVKVGNKVMTVADLQRIAAREKRSGKKAGRNALVKQLGFESEDDLAEALKNAPKAKKDDDDDQGDDEARRAREKREQERQEERARQRAKERKLDLRGALRDAGVSRADLDAGEALLDRIVDSDYDDDDLEDGIEELKRTRAGKALFDDDDADDKPERRQVATLPPGRAKRKNHPDKKPFGSGGLERAKRKGWIKES